MLHVCVPLHLHNDLFWGKSFERGVAAETTVLMDRCPVKISANAKTNGLLYMQHIQRMGKDWWSLSLGSRLHAAHRFLRKYAALIFTILSNITFHWKDIVMRMNMSVTQALVIQSCVVRAAVDFFSFWKCLMCSDLCVVIVLALDFITLNTDNIIHFTWWKLCF